MRATSFGASVEVAARQALLVQGEDRRPQTAAWVRRSRWSSEPSHQHDVVGATQSGGSSTQRRTVRSRPMVVRSRYRDPAPGSILSVAGDDGRTHDPGRRAAVAVASPASRRVPGARLRGRRAPPPAAAPLVARADLAVYDRLLARAPRAALLGPRRPRRGRRATASPRPGAGRGRATGSPAPHRIRALGRRPSVWTSSSRSPIRAATAPAGRGGAGRVARALGPGRGASRRPSGGASS